MKKLKIKGVWIGIILLSLSLICWDLATSLNAEVEEGTFKSESEFDAVTAATTKVAVVPSDYSELSETVARNVDPGYDQIELMVRKALELQGGLEWIISKGDKVMIKPNIVEKDTPSGLGENTDVRVVKALIKIIWDFTGGDVEIVVAEGCPRAGYDDPTSSTSSWEASGYRDLLTDSYLTGINFRLLNLNKEYADLIEVDLGGKGSAAPHGYKYMIHKEELDADVYISVPVLKIHDTGITCGLKNQIGTAPGSYYGYNKMKGSSYYGGLVHDVGHRRWTDEEIVDLSAISGIDLVVVDAIMCLETVKTYETSNQVRMNTIIAGVDPVAVDHVCTKLFCLNPDDIAHITLSEKIGLGTNDSAKIEITGASIDDVKKKVKKNQSANGKFGQSNRTWILSPAYTGTDITTEYIPNEATLIPKPGESGWSQPVYFYDDRIDLLSYYGGQSGIVTYAYTNFYSPVDREAELWIGNDEAIYIYVNGEKVYTYTSTRTYADSDIKVATQKITIRQGENTLLVKTLHRYADFSFALNICEVESNTLYAGNRVPGLKFYPASLSSNLPVEITKNIHQVKIFPDPVKSISTVEFYVQKGNLTTVDIFDVNGRLVKNLSNEYLAEGIQKVHIFKDDFKPGIYFCVIKNNTISSKKFIIE